LAGVEGRLAGVEVRSERHEIPLSAQDSTLQRAARGTSLSPYRSICKLLDTPAPHLPRIPVPRCRVNKGRAELLGSGPLVSLVFVH
jgi:hypothetical protein